MKIEQVKIRKVRTKATNRPEKRGRSISAPRIVVGDLYDDKWCTPYIRCDFDLKPGRYAMEVEIWNPEIAAFLNNRIDVRRGLSFFDSTGPLAVGALRLLSTDFDMGADSAILSVSLRSTVSWQPPAPDRRSLGFMVLRWECRPLD